MTDNEFDNKLFELSYFAFLRVKEAATRKWKSGAIDRAACKPNDFMPVKACLSDALREVSIDVRPLSEEGREITNNLKHF